MSDAFRMRPIYDVLLRGSNATPMGLYQLHLTTADQLTRLHYSPGTLKAVKARLKTLEDNGYVQADRIPTKAYKSPYYYTLGTAGIRYLSELGYDMETSLRAQKETDKHGLFIDHTLEVNDLLVAAATLHHIEPNYRLSYHLHERELKRHPFKVKWKSPEGDNGSLTLIPDAFLDFHMTGSRMHLRLALEHDRGTEGPQFFRKKVRAYIGLLKSGSYRSLFRADKLTVAFSTFHSEDRVAQLREWTEAELQVTNEPWEVGGSLIFAYLPPVPSARQAWLEAHWQSAYAANTQHYALLETATESVAG